MSFTGLTASVSGIDSITKKKLELYRDCSRVRLFFGDKPDLSRSICVLPVEMLPLFFSIDETPSLLKPPVLGFGPPEAMNLSIAAGCADYLCSPWSPDEFFIRIVRCLKMVSFRYKDASFFAADGEIVCLKDDGLMHTVKLSNTEIIILKAFSRNRGHFFTRGLLSQLLSRCENDGSRAVDMYISRLRGKIAELCLESGILPEDSPIRTSTGRGWGIL